MKANHIRHLPVVSKGRKLEGLVTLADLKQGLLPSMLGDVDLKDLMITDPFTVAPGRRHQTAAQIIYKHKRQLGAFRAGECPCMDPGRVPGGTGRCQGRANGG